jgi:hypothetical protein
LWLPPSIDLFESEKISMFTWLAVPHIGEIIDFGELANRSISHGVAMPVHHNVATAHGVRNGGLQLENHLNIDILRHICEFDSLCRVADSYV